MADAELHFRTLHRPGRPRSSNGELQGVASISVDGETTSISERGSWVADGKHGRQAGTRTRSDWRIDRVQADGPETERLRVTKFRATDSPAVVSLERSRGSDAGSTTWHSIAPHPCGEDLYHLVLTLDAQGLPTEAVWTIRGPQKNDTLRTTYATLRSHSQRP